MNLVSIAGLLRVFKIRSRNSVICSFFNSIYVSYLSHFSDILCVWKSIYHHIFSCILGKTLFFDEKIKASEKNEKGCICQMIIQSGYPKCSLNLNENRIISTKRQKQIQNFHCTSRFWEQKVHPAFPTLKRARLW